MLPKGELRGAVGVSKRKNTVQFTPDQFIDRENLVDVPIGLFGANDTGGSTDVEEIYGELLVPITGKFNLELGVRSSDYNTTGRLETYKALFDYSVTDSVRLRGGRQVANRAPNTAELFAGKQQQVVGLSFSDPCAVSTIAPWGNLASNPNRAQMQQLCSAIINSPTSHVRSESEHLRHVLRLLPARARQQRGQSERRQRGGRNVHVRRDLGRRQPERRSRLVRRRDHGRDRVADRGHDLRAVLQRERRDEPDVLDQRSGWILPDDGSRSRERRPAARQHDADQRRRDSNLGRRRAGELEQGSSGRARCSPTSC